MCDYICVNACVCMSVFLHISVCVCEYVFVFISFEHVCDNICFFLLLN